MFDAEWVTVFTWFLQSNLRTWNKLLNPLWDHLQYRILKDLLSNGSHKALSQHILLWCTVQYSTVWTGNYECNVPRILEDIWHTLYKINDCFKTVRPIQLYYNRTGIFQMDCSITYKLEITPIRSGYLTFMLRWLYTGKILAPNLISQTIMALLSRTSLSIKEMIQCAILGIPKKMKKCSFYFFLPWPFDQKRKYNFLGIQNKKPFEIILHEGRVISLWSWVAKKSCHGQTLINEYSISDYPFNHTYIDESVEIFLKLSMKTVQVHLIIWTTLVRYRGSKFQNPPFYLHFSADTSSVKFFDKLTFLGFYSGCPKQPHIHLTGFIQSLKTLEKFCDFH